MIVSQKAATICSVQDGSEGGVSRHVDTHTGGSNLTLTTLLETSKSVFSFWDRDRSLVTLRRHFWDTSKYKEIPMARETCLTTDVRTKQGKINPEKNVPASPLDEEPGMWSQHFLLPTFSTDICSTDNFDLARFRPATASSIVGMTRGNPHGPCTSHNALQAVFCIFVRRELIRWREAIAAEAIGQRRNA